MRQWWIRLQFPQQGGNRSRESFLPGFIDDRAEWFWTIREFELAHRFQ